MIRDAAVLLTIAAALAVPAAANADTTLTLNGPAAKSLRVRGVKIYEQLPARGIGSKIEFPVSGGAIATNATIEQQGELRFKRGKRKLILKSVQVVVGPGIQSLSAISGKIRVTIFSIRTGHSKPRLNVAASTAKLTGAKLRFTGAAAKLMRKKLGTGPNTRLSAGTIKVRATIPVAPAIFARPATAVDIASATIKWHVRESFVDYLIGNGGGGSASHGAIGGGSPYDFTFMTRPGGWFDAASGTADVLGQGTVRFTGPAHGIDVSTFDPEIELNGPRSRTIFRFADGKRKVLFGLASTNPPTTPFGPVNVPGIVLQGSGEDLFGGFYLPGDEFGYVTVSFST